MPLPSSSQGQQFCFGTDSPKILLADCSVPFCTRGPRFLLFSLYLFHSILAGITQLPPNQDPLKWMTLYYFTPLHLREFLPPVMHVWVNKTDILKGSIIYKGWRQNFLVDTKTWMPMHSGIVGNIPEEKAAFHQGHTYTNISPKTQDS